MQTMWMLGLRPRPRWESSQRSPDPLAGGPGCLLPKNPHLLSSFRASEFHTHNFLTPVQFSFSRNMPAQGVGAPQFWGFSSIYAYTLQRRTTMFFKVNYVGRGVFWVSHASHPKGAGSQRSTIGEGVPFYLCVYHLTQNDRVRQSNIWRTDTQ